MSQYSGPVIREAAKEAGRRLGYRQMKPEQLRVVESFLKGSDVFGVLPTGYGKSLCYACLPIAFDILLQRPQGSSIVLVVSPLVAILKDQVCTYSAKGISAAYVIGDSPEVTRESVEQGKFQLVYISPELLICNSRWRKMLTGDIYARRLVVFVVDEAHTVKKWGETFCEVLGRLGEVRSLLPQNVRILALTATATKTVQVSVASTLGMEKPQVISLSPCKSNLVYNVGVFTTIEETFRPLLQRLKLDEDRIGRMIIYCQSFKMCADIYIYLLQGLGSLLTKPVGAPNISRFRLVDMFTSVTEPKQKDDIIKLFTTPSQLRVVIATVAFGLGIDCPNVRQIVHVGMPEDLESYIQETGRAGRDGQPALATLLKSRTYHTCERSMKDYANNDSQCRRDALFNHMEGYKHAHTGSNCFCCDICALVCGRGSCSDKLASFVFF